MDFIKNILEWLGYIFAFIGLLATVYKSIQAWASIKKFTWQDVDKYTKLLIKQIVAANYEPDVIVTVGRGGAIVGSLLSGNLPQTYSAKHNVTILGTDRVYEWKDGQRLEVENKMIDYTPLASQKVLLVAGDVITGGTMKFMTNELREANVAELKTACLVKGMTSAFNPDYFGKEIPAGFTMPWMYKGNHYIKDSREPDKSKQKSKWKFWA